MTDKEIIKGYIKNLPYLHKVTYYIGLVRYKVDRSRIDYNIKAKANGWHPFLFFLIVLFFLAHIALGIIDSAKEFIKEVKDMFRWN